MSYGGWGDGGRPYDATDDVQVGNNVSVHVGDTVDGTEGEVDEDATHNGQKTLCGDAERHGSKEEKKKSGSLSLSFFLLMVLGRTVTQIV